MKKLLITLLFLSVSSNLYAAGFDCSKARTLVEKTICSNPDLSALDDALTDVYRKLIDPKLCTDYQIPYLQEDQKNWLKETRNKCTDARCLSKVYSTRINEINSAIARPSKVTVAKDKITGTYDTQCYGILGIGGGELKLKAAADGKVQFLLNCNRGSPSFNMGFLKGVISLKPKGITKYTAPKNEDGDCEMEFDFTDSSKIHLKQIGDPWACGFGMGVDCSGDYQLNDSKIPDIKSP